MKHQILQIFWVFLRKKYIKNVKKQIPFIKQQKNTFIE